VIDDRREDRNESEEEATGAGMMSSCLLGTNSAWLDGLLLRLRDSEVSTARGLVMSQIRESQSEC
jgi:hypothetical protein